MSPKRKPEYDDDLLPEYDFSGAVRGKYYERYRQGTNVVLLVPAIAPQAGERGSRLSGNVRTTDGTTRGGDSAPVRDGRRLRRQDDNR